MTPDHSGNVLRSHPDNIDIVPLHASVQPALFDVLSYERIENSL